MLITCYALQATWDLGNTSFQIKPQASDRHMVLMEQDSVCVFNFNLQSKWPPKKKTKQKKNRKSQIYRVTNAGNDFNILCWGEISLQDEGT